MARKKTRKTGKGRLRILQTSDGKEGQEAKAAPQVIMVPFRGKTQPIQVGSVVMPLMLALLALEDAKVDAVLTAYGVRVTNARGECIWPEE